MPIDSSIYNLVGRGVKSVNDYDTEAANLVGLRQKNLLGGIDVQNAQQAQADDQGFRTAAANFSPTDTMGNYQAALKVSPKLAQGYLKSSLDNKETQAKTSHFNAQTGEIESNQKIKGHQQHLADLGSLTDPSQIDAWAAKGVLDGVMGFQESAQGAQQMKDFAAQHGFEAAKAQAMRGGVSALEQLKLKQNERDFGLKNANEIMTAGPDGSYGVNAPLVAAKAHVAKSGAGSTNIKIDNALGETVAKQVGPMVEQSYNAAAGAQASLANADSIINAIDSGKVIAGPGADARLKLAQVADMLGMGGKDTKEKIANTRSTIQGLNQSILTARAQLKGQGQVSDYEGKLLAKATAGDIEDLTAPEIRQLAVLNKKLSNQVITQHGQLITKLKGHTPTAPLADLFETNPGNPPAPPAAAPSSISGSPPTGWKVIR